MLISVEDQEKLSRFCQYFASNLAREIGRKWNWTGRVWSRRYSGLLVADDEATQMARLRYVLEQGVKANLVEDPADWPGASTASHLVTGRSTVDGLWVDRTKQYRAKCRGVDLSDEEAGEETAFELSPLPCWAHLDRLERMARVQEMVTDIKRKARDRRKAEGVSVLGVERLRTQDPMQRSENLDRSWGPMFLAPMAQLDKWWRAYKEFVGAYLAASVAYRRYGGSVEAFPRPCFVPSTGFLPTQARAPD